MIDEVLKKLREVNNFENAIINSIVLEELRRRVTVKLVTDKAYSKEDKACAENAVRSFVPEFFESVVEILKLTPDNEMIKRKILEGVEENFKAISVTLGADDIKVEKTENGYDFEISVMQSLSSTDGVSESVINYLKKCYCGEFTGRCVKSLKSANEIQVEEDEENTEFEVPVRRFDISNFKFLEGTEKQTSAVYLCDMNFESEKVIVCGRIEDIQERTFKTGKNKDKTYYSYTLNDDTAMLRLTYFPRQKSIEKIKALKIGDSIVCTCKSEQYNGFIRLTANFIDYGSMPEGFVPEKRTSKPVPKYYGAVKPRPYSDIEQTDMFTKSVIPDCLKGKTFVVFDLETTGLNSAASSGNMDRIIEIGAYKVVDGVIAESFTTFINPQKKLSDEIIRLTGITEEMVASAPTYEQVMPDFFKFCHGAILVGHNIAGFDFKFVDYYCAKLGYMLERKIIDTIPLSQELLFLSNYKLNTVADRFGIVFNHHRAIDDALVTAKIFIELIKIKKSLPKLQ
ncbi:MAG: hypothetical protein K2I30_05840 [Clostridia bacterium]|nr:hypothetical protein [Clostridia bacterium]